MKPPGSTLLGWIAVGLLVLAVLATPDTGRAAGAGPPADAPRTPMAMPRPAWDRQGSRESYAWLAWMAVPAVIGIGGIVAVVVMGRKERNHDSTTER